VGDRTAEQIKFAVGTAGLDPNSAEKNGWKSAEGIF